MRKLKASIIIPVMMASGLMLALPAQAEARTHGRVVHAHGPNGGGYHAGRAVSREPGSAQVTRGIVTHNGRGVHQTRSTDWGNGVIHNEVDRSYRHGGSVKRDTTVTRNGNGSVTVDRDRTGVRGNEQSSWTTIYRTDDGYTRTRGASTSNGRGYNTTRDVSVSDDYVTVQRSASNNRGGSASSTRNYRRPN